MPRWIHTGRIYATTLNRLNQLWVSDMGRDLLDLESALRSLIPVQPTFGRDEFFYQLGFAAGHSTGSLFQKLQSLIRSAKLFK